MFRLAWRRFRSGFGTLIGAALLYQLCMIIMAVAAGFMGVISIGAGGVSMMAAGVIPVVGFLVLLLGMAILSAGFFGVVLSVGEGSPKAYPLLKTGRRCWLHLLLIVVMQQVITWLLNLGLALVVPVLLLPLVQLLFTVVITGSMLVAIFLVIRDEAGIFPAISAGIRAWRYPGSLIAMVLIPLLISLLASGVVSGGTILAGFLLMSLSTAVTIAVVALLVVLALLLTLYGLVLAATIFSERVYERVTAA